MFRRKIVTLLAFLAVGGITWCARPMARGLPRSGKVVDVLDGDTIVIEARKVRYECRLLGIDAPELSYKFLWQEMDKLLKYTSGRPRRELETAQKVFRKRAKLVEWFARKARGMLSDRVKRKTVELTYDRKEGPRDKYDRLLVYVSLRGKDVSAEMIRSGLAVPDVRFSASRLGFYRELWRTVQADRVGLWKMRAKDWEPPPEAETEVWGSRRSKKYHLPTCRSAQNIKPENLVKFTSAQEARDMGYVPCQTCKPPEE